MPRVTVFIDGFNFYFGLMDAGHGNCRWLDWVKLAHRLNTGGREVVGVRYYTARVKRDADAAQRQGVYLDALAAEHPSSLTIIEGRMQWEPVKCKHCHQHFDHRVEKHTDVNIAADMVALAYQNAFDVAMLISGDADQVAAVEAVRLTGREVRVVFPPNRTSEHLKTAADTAYPLNPAFLAQCQLPDVVWAGQYQRARPLAWR